MNHGGAIFTLISCLLVSSLAGGESLRLRSGASFDGRAMTRADGIVFASATGGIYLIATEHVEAAGEIETYDPAEILGLAADPKCPPGERDSLLEVILAFDPDHPVARRTRRELRVDARWAKEDRLIDLESQFKPWAGWGEGERPPVLDDPERIRGRSDDFEMIAKCGAIRADALLERADFLLRAWRERFAITDWPVPGVPLALLASTCSEADPCHRTQGRHSAIHPPVAHVWLGPWDAAGNLGHALAHQFMERTSAVNIDAIPTWLIEGGAEWLTNTASADGGTAQHRVGGLDHRQLHRLNELLQSTQWIPISKIIEAKPIDVHGRAGVAKQESDWEEKLALQSLALFDWLMSRTDDNGAARQTIESFLAAPQSITAAQFTALVDNPDLDTLVKGHVRALARGEIVSAGLAGAEPLWAARIDELAPPGAQAAAIAVRRAQMLALDQIRGWGTSPRVAERFLIRAAELGDPRLVAMRETTRALVAFDPAPEIRALARLDARQSLAVEHRLSEARASLAGRTEAARQAALDVLWQDGKRSDLAAITSVSAAESDLAVKRRASLAMATLDAPTADQCVDLLDEAFLGDWSHSGLLAFELARELPPAGLSAAELAPWLTHESARPLKLVAMAAALLARVDAESAATQLHDWMLQANLPPMYLRPDGVIAGADPEAMLFFAHPEYAPDPESWSKVLSLTRAKFVGDLTSSDPELSQRAFDLLLQFFDRAVPLSDSDIASISSAQLVIGDGGAPVSLQATARVLRDYRANLDGDEKALVSFLDSIATLQGAIPQLAALAPDGAQSLEMTFFAPAGLARRGGWRAVFGEFADRPGARLAAGRAASRIDLGVARDAATFDRDAYEKALGAVVYLEGPGAEDALIEALSGERESMLLAARSVWERGLARWKFLEIIDRALAASNANATLLRKMREEIQGESSVDQIIAEVQAGADGKLTVHALKSTAAGISAPPPQMREFVARILELATDPDYQVRHRALAVFAAIRVDDGLPMPVPARARADHVHRALARSQVVVVASADLLREWSRAPAASLERKLLARHFGGLGWNDRESHTGVWWRAVVEVVDITSDASSVHPVGHIGGWSFSLDFTGILVGLFSALAIVIGLSLRIHRRREHTRRISERVHLRRHTSPPTKSPSSIRRPD